MITSILDSDLKLNQWEHHTIAVGAKQATDDLIKKFPELSTLKKNIYFYLNTIELSNDLLINLDVLIKDLNK